MSSPATTVIFCDGACSGNPGPGGWGAIVATPDGRARELGGGARHTTNNQMELTAATEALKLVADVPGNVVVYTDSTYVIKGITQWIKGWRRNGWKSSTGGDVANRDYWEKLAAAADARGARLAWHYVKGHAGTPGNERADAIAVAFAKGAAPVLYDGPMASYPVALHELSAPGAKKASSSKGKTAYSYVSLLEGLVERHATWADCEKRVRGKSNAKFRKAVSADDEAEILRSWGVTSRPK